MMTITTRFRVTSPHYEVALQAARANASGKEFVALVSMAEVALQAKPRHYYTLPPQADASCRVGAVYPLLLRSPWPG